MPWNGGSANGDPWHVCQRCGKQYPLSHLVRQAGLLICVDTCYDQPDIWHREQNIEEVLSEPETESQNVTYLEKDTGEEDFPGGNL